MSISYPATLPEDHYIALSSTAAGVNNILGYSWGLTHAEFIKSNQDGEFYLVESSNRGGGCHTSNVIVPYCSGISTVPIMLELSLSNPISILPPPTRNHVVLQFFNFNDSSDFSYDSWLSTVSGFNSLRHKLLIDTNSKSLQLPQMLTVMHL